jgi:hypothetical protein
VQEALRKGLKWVVNDMVVLEKRWCGLHFLNFVPDALSAHIRNASLLFGSLIHSLGTGSLLLLGPN